MPDILIDTVVSGTRQYDIVFSLAAEQFMVRGEPHLRAPDLPGLRALLARHLQGHGTSTGWTYIRIDAAHGGPWCAARVQLFSGPQGVYEVSGDGATPTALRDWPAEKDPASAARVSLEQAGRWYLPFSTNRWENALKAVQILNDLQESIFPAIGTGAADLRGIGELRAALDALQ